MNTEKRDRLEKMIRGIIAAVFAVFLVYNVSALFRIAVYNHPCTDDYWMSEWAYHAWVDTRSVFSAVRAAWNYTVYLYKNHDACVISMFLTALSPAIAEKTYKFVFYFIAAVLMGASAFFWQTLLRRCLRFKVGYVFYMWTVFSVALLNFMPGTGEAFYWWPGAVNYTFFFSVMLITHSFILRYCVGKKKSMLILSCTGAFLMGLGNLMSGLLSPLLILCEILLFSLSKRSLKEFRLMFLVLFFGIAGLLVNVLAPGNLMRGGEGMLGQNIFMVIWDTITTASVFFGAFTDKSLVILWILSAVIMFAGFQSGDVQYRFKLPGVFFAAAFLLACACFTPVIYAKYGFVMRVLNLLCMVMILMVFLSIVYLMGWLNQKLRNRVTGKHIENIAVAVCAVLLLATSKVCEPEFANYTAAISLNNGEAMRFDTTVRENVAKFTNPYIDYVEIENIESIPDVFFYSPKESLPYWIRYYRKNITIIE